MIERMVDILADELEMDAAELRFKNFIQPEQFPYKSPTGWEYDSGNYPAALTEGAGQDRLRGAAARAGREARARRADGDRHLDLHRDRRRRALAHLRHPRHQDVRQRRDPHPPDRLGDRPHRRPDPGPGPRDDLRPDRRRGAGPAGRQHRGRARRHRHRALRARHLRQPQHADRRRGDGDGRPQDPREGAAAGRPPAGGQRRRPGVGRPQVPGQGRARAQPRRCRRSPSPPTPTTRRGWRPAWRRSTTTTRRT